MRITTAFFAVFFLVSSSLTAFAAPLPEHLTIPIQKLCERMLSAKGILLGVGKGVNVRVQIEAAERLKQEIKKDSPDVPQIIQDLLTLTPPPSASVKIAKRAIDV